MNKGRPSCKAGLTCTTSPAYAFLSRNDGGVTGEINLEHTQASASSQSRWQLGKQQRYLDGSLDSRVSTCAPVAAESSVGLRRAGDSIVSPWAALVSSPNSDFLSYKKKKKKNITRYQKNSRIFSGLA